MIAKAYITEWQQRVPWPIPSMVEQDLIICRALFDLWHAFTGSGCAPEVDRIIEAFRKYMEDGGHQVTRAMFEQNFLEKREDPQFTGDIRPLLTAAAAWDFDTAFEFVLGTLIAKLPGEPWQGRSLES